MFFRTIPLTLFVLVNGLSLFLLSLDSSDAGGLAGKKLLVDTQIGPGLGYVNDEKTVLPPHPKGKTIQIELYVEGAHAHKTSGYTITFENSRNSFKDFFIIEKIEGLLGQVGKPGSISVVSGSFFPSIVQANNYIATITLTTRQPVPNGTTISFNSRKTVIIDSRTSEIDKIDVSEAFINFNSERDFSISLDLDKTPDDQELKILAQVHPNAEIPIQIFGTDILYAVGLIIRFEYDGSKVTFLRFDSGDVLPNNKALEPVLGKIISGFGSSPDYVEITTAALGGTSTKNKGLLGIIRFLTSSYFEGTTIRMVNAEIRRSGGFVKLEGSLSLELKKFTSDFDNDGHIGKRDFLLFAEKYGSQRGDGIYNELFDLDGDYIVEFSDFLILLKNFSQTK